MEEGGTKERKIGWKDKLMEFREWRKETFGDDDDKRWSKSIVKPIYQYLRGLANSFGNLTVIGL